MSFATLLELRTSHLNTQNGAAQSLQERSGVFVLSADTAVWPPDSPHAYRRNLKVRIPEILSLLSGVVVTFAWLLLLPPVLFCTRLANTNFPSLQNRAPPLWFSCRQKSRVMPSQMCTCATKTRRVGCTQQESTSTKRRSLSCHFSTHTALASSGSKKARPDNERLQQCSSRQNALS